MSGETPVLRLAHITKRYGGVVALRDVEFSVLPGEVHGLVGKTVREKARS